MITVELVHGQARATVLETGARLRPRLLDVAGRHVRIALVAVCATLLAGDQSRLDIRVGSGVKLELYEPSATVAYNARGGRATWQATVRVAAGGELIWRAAPFVIAEGAHVHKQTDLDLAEDARALLADTVVLGRSDEAGGDLVLGTHAVHGGRELLVEELDLRVGGMRNLVGMLADARVLCTLCLLGVRDVEARAPHETPLYGAGALARWLARQAHEAEPLLDATWSRWRGLLSA